MKKNKLLLPLILVMGLATLTGCNLFNDDDLAFSNNYNTPSTEPTSEPDGPKAGGVVGKVVEEAPDSYCFKSIGYAKDEKIPNTYKTGGANENEYNVNQGQDYPATRSGNNYDLYVPNSASRTGKHTVILFIHGGAWVSGFKTDVNPYVFEFANRGYVTATIKYTLLKRSMDDPSLSIFRNLDEIDACITSIKESLTELGFDTSKSELVVGGASSGAHLAMLYSYSRGSHSDIPIKFIVDAVGPVDIKPACWKSFKNASDEVLTAGLSPEAIADQEAASNIGELAIAGEAGKTWNDYQTLRVANGMCGLPYTLETVRAATDENERDITNPTNEAYISMTKAGGGEDLLSVTHWISATNKLPIICAYAGKDSIVGINQYATLETTLKFYSVQREYFYFKNSGHSDISKQADETQYNAFVNKVDEWCKA